jgi:hypothetical protein
MVKNFWNEVVRNFIEKPRPRPGNASEKVFRDQAFDGGVLAPHAGDFGGIDEEGGFLFGVSTGI